MIKKLKDFWKLTRILGLRSQLLHVLTYIALKTGRMEFYYKLTLMGQRRILRFLGKKYGHILQEYREQENVVSKSCGKIWVCWWQGEDNAPGVVKTCISSIRKNAGAHEVVVITLDNYPEYVKIPAHIVDKFKCGNISYAHFSDVLRMALLAKHGGLWLDATYYCFNPIHESIFDMPFFTARWKEDDGYKYWYPYPFCVINEDGEKIGWSQNAIGGEKGYPLYSFVSEVFSEYLSEYSCFIDYFLMDYIIRLAYDNIPAIKKDIDAIPVNNEKTFILGKIRNDEYNGEVIDSLRQSNTMFFKLNYRAKCNEYTESGKETVYKRLIQGNL